ncbi:hypothetical protein THAOC_07949, partial [Thalassiosira oceanica]
ALGGIDLTGVSRDHCLPPLRPPEFVGANQSSLCAPRCLLAHGQGASTYGGSLGTKDAATFSQKSPAMLGLAPVGCLGCAACSIGRYVTVTVT